MDEYTGAIWAADLALGVHTERGFGSISARAISAAMSSAEHTDRLAARTEAARSIYRS